MSDLLNQFSDTRVDSIPHIQKTQFVRFYIDILFIAPFLFYLISKKTPLTTTEKVLLGSIGAGVLFFNGQRYLITKKALENAQA